MTATLSTAWCISIAWRKWSRAGGGLAFAALVIAGDQRGRAGFGHGKAREVPEAIRKATEVAKKSMQRVPLYEGRTLHHEVKGRWGAGRVILRPAQPGRGIIAGSAMRPIFEALGIQDIVAKSLGSSNPYNMVRATFNALAQQSNPRQIAARRGKKLSEIIAHRRSADVKAEAVEKEEISGQDKKDKGGER